MKKPIILLTNDDGIDSPGLLAVAKILEPIGELLIVAPHQQQSATGRSYRPIIDRKVHRHIFLLNGESITAFSIDGTPAQVTTKGVLDLADRPVSLVVSGINFGENIGSGIASSGTVGAALEAASMGIPAMAVSLQTAREYYFSNSDEVDFTAAAYFTRYFAEKILSGVTFPTDVDVLKIDVPADATRETPWRTTSISRQPYHYGIPSEPQNRGKFVDPGYDTRVEFDTLEAESDIYALIVDNVVSVAPVSLDMTSRVTLQDLQSHLGD